MMVENTKLTNSEEKKHKRYIIIIIPVLLGVILLLAGLDHWLAKGKDDLRNSTEAFSQEHLQEKEEPSKVERTNISDEDVIKTLNKSQGEYWYGMYLNNQKVGYTNYIVFKKKAKDKDLYGFKKEDIMRIASQGKETPANVLFVVTFNADPPFELYSYETLNAQGKSIVAHTKLLKKQDGYDVEIYEIGNIERRRIKSLNYTLRDYYAVELWLQQGNRTVGDSINYTYFDIKSLKTTELTAQLSDIKSKRIDDLKLHSYGVILKEIGVKLVYNHKGIASKVFPPGPNHYELEPEEKATKIDKPVDLSVLLANTVAKSDKSIDKQGFISRIEIAIKEMPGIVFENGAGQRVVRDKKNDRYLLTISYSGTEQAASPEEINDYLKTTQEIPAKDPRVITLAHKAVGNAKSIYQKVLNLTEFVSRYVNDIQIHRRQSVLDTLTLKTGDCTEHAQLFTAMARSLGIPCRTVGGLHYLGKNEFAGHMWCEVVINGYWKQVDPTLNQFPIDALHIRFPTDEAQCYANMKAIQDTTIEILDIGYGE